MDNVLTNGNMAGWKFTIDKFRLNVFHNKLIGAGMEGKIHLPILKDGENFEYTAAMLPGNAYQFTVKPPKQGLAVDLWVADVTFTEGTVVDIEYVNDKFKASAVLYGDINVNSGDVIKMDNFTFQNVVISTDEAVVNPGKWGIPAFGAHVKGFSLTISNIALTKEDKNGITTTKLNVSAEVTLAESKSQSLLLNAGGNFDILGEVTKNSANEQVWKYKDIQLNSFFIKMTTNSFQLDGKLTFYREDKIYGEGFYGGVLLNLSKPQTTIAVAAVFGKVKNSNNELYKYFFVDAFVKLPKAIPLGPLGLTGLGGGISWHMEKQDFNNLDLDKAAEGKVDKDDKPVVPEMTAPKSLTGATYYPNDNIGLGLKIMTTFQLAETPRAFNGGAALEIVFDADGSINNIGLNGVAHIMAEPSNIPEFTLDPKNLKEGIHAGLKLKYDFNADIFTANMEAYVNIENRIIGCGSPGLTVQEKCKEYKLGEIDMYFNIPGKKWYIKIGRTDPQGNNRIGLGVGIEDMGYIVATAYFNIGNYDIKPMPPMPDYAQKLLTSTNVKFNDNSTARSSGKAFAFGADMNLNLSFNAFVYATLKFDFGFDFMMTHRPGVTCANFGNRPIGVNYWYAEGQIYARLMGDVGIKIKSKSFSLGNVTAIAAMKGGGPNPFWAVGAASIAYKVLFIKGQAQVQVSMGKQCDMVTTTDPNVPNPDTQIIEKITPDKGTDKVSVMAKPVINFLTAIDEKQYSPEGEVDIKAVVNKIKLFDGTKELYCGLFISEDKMSYTLKPSKMLPSNKKLTLIVEAAVHELKSNNELGEELFSDRRTIEFTTEKLTTIPEENIESSYPINGMFNYYRNEDVANKGFIHLRNDQQELFDEMPYDRIPEIQFFTEGQFICAVPFTHSNQKLSFEMPNDKLKREKIYKMNVVFASDIGEVPQILLTQYFRVSKYNSLFEKLHKIDISASNGINLSAIDEPFDALELGTPYNPGLLTLNFSDGGWSNSISNLFEKQNGKEFLLYEGVPKDVKVKLDVKFNGESTIGKIQHKDYTIPLPSKIDKSIYESNTLTLNNTFEYRFKFDVVDPNLRSEMIGNFSSYSGYYASTYCVLGETLETDSDGEKAYCVKDINEKANKYIDRFQNDSALELPPPPNKHTFYFNYTLPKDNVPTSIVEKVWEH